MATVIISRLADEHNLENPESDASKIVINDMMPKLKENNADYVFFGQIYAAPGGATLLKFGILLIGWKDNPEASMKRRTGYQTYRELLLEDLHRMNHRQFSDPLLDDFIFGCIDFKPFAKSVTSIVTLSGVGDTAVEKYKTGIVEAINYYTQEYEARQKSRTLEQLQPPPTVYLEDYMYFEDLSKPHVGMVRAPCDFSMLDRALWHVALSEREKIQGDLRVGNYAANMFRAL